MYKKTYVVLYICIVAMMLQKTKKTEIMNNTNIEDRIIEFLNGLDTEIDLAYFATNSMDDLKNDLTFEKLTEILNENNAFDEEVIYYAAAIQYLQKNDPSLSESMALASEMGYEVKNITSEILATLHSTQINTAKYFELEDEITEFFEDLK